MEHRHDAATAAAGVSGKRLATLRARAALAGITVHQLADGGLLGCRWNQARYLPDLDALERWLSQQGVRK